MLIEAQLRQYCKLRQSTCGNALSARRSIPIPAAEHGLSSSSGSVTVKQEDVSARPEDANASQENASPKLENASVEQEDAGAK